MPWIKATPTMNGNYTIDFKSIRDGKIFNTADDCMDSFTRFEKDSSFGSMVTCRPVFFPLNDDELNFFNKIVEGYRGQIGQLKKNEKTEELASTLLELIKAIKEKI